MHTYDNPCIQSSISATTSISKKNLFTTLIFVYQQSCAEAKLLI